MFNYNNVGGCCGNMGGGFGYQQPMYFNPCCGGNQGNSSFAIILVLFILLVIVIGARGVR